MKTRLSADNPFGYNRYGYAFENIQDGTRCLDFGCYDASFIAHVLRVKTLEYIGVDRNRDIVEKNPHTQTIRLMEDWRLPLEDATVDCVTILDVIEHIHDQVRTLSEINRVVRLGGSLIVTVPGRHIFSFLDTGNFKFAFPRLHRLYYTRAHSAEEYDHRYVNNPSGLIGDIEAGKAWHQHFRRKELAQLLAQCGFRVEEFDGSGLFQRVFAMLDLARVGKVIPQSLREWDLRRFSKTNLFCRASKVKSVTAQTENY